MKETLRVLEDCKLAEAERIIMELHVQVEAARMELDDPRSLSLSRFFFFRLSWWRGGEKIRKGKRKV